MITNQSYLDNPTFRGMRQSLMNSFNEIYITDFDGNSLKKETAVDGRKDENEFDIRQGNAIVLMVKQLNKKGCQVFHRDLFGTRETKYEHLENNLFEFGDYQKLIPETPWYFFIPNKMKELEHYNSWWKVNDIFPVNSVGIVTARDDFAIDFQLNSLRNRILQFRDLKFDELFLKEAYKLTDSSSFKLTKSRKEVAIDNEWDEKFNEILYRPFDHRFIFYSSSIIERMRFEVMRNLQKDNLALTIGRQGQVVGDELNWNLALITERIIDFNLFYRGGELVFPLYLFPEDQSKRKGIQMMLLFEPEQEYGKQRKIANIAPKLLHELEIKYGKKPEPEEILYYVYAVLYSNSYREKYAEFLKIDFPRIPFVDDYQTFTKLAEIGKELADLHLLKHKSLEHPSTKYRTNSVINQDNDLIEKITYIPEQKAIYINENRYFDNIEPEDWEYQIGGYKVLYQYLKSRKGRQMDDPGHFCKMASAIRRTREVQGKMETIK